MIVGILGTNYTVEQDDSLNNSMLDGLCKSYSKQITHRGIKNMLCEDDPMEVKQVRFSEVLRHELIHAFFHEAGLENYGSDEVLVDWMAKQFPKMVKTMQDCGALTKEELSNG